MQELLDDISSRLGLNDTSLGSYDTPADSHDAQLDFNEDDNEQEHNTTAHH
jgi:hypothetical protein